jgi:hypothetical protein
MSWLIRLGYLFFIAGVLTPISGHLFSRELDPDTHFYFSSLAAALCLLGILAVSIGRRDHGRHGRNARNYSGAG